MTYGGGAFPAKCTDKPNENNKHKKEQTLRLQKNIGHLGIDSIRASVRQFQVYLRVLYCRFASIRLHIPFSKNFVT